MKECKDARGSATSAEDKAKLVKIMQECLTRIKQLDEDAGLTWDGVSGSTCMYLNEDGATVDEIASAITNRIQRQHLDLLRQFDLMDLMAAIQDVAEFHEGTEELGTSDVGGMVRQVIKQLERSRKVMESGSSPLVDKLRASFAGINTIDPDSPTYAKLLALLDKLSEKQLQELVDAKIKFVSGLARNRINRKKVSEAPGAETLAHNQKTVQSNLDAFDLGEGEEFGTFSALKDWQVWEVPIWNNYYRGKYADYSPRNYPVIASSPEEAKEVVLANADAILQQILKLKLHNGKRVLPPRSALPITADRLGPIKDGTEVGRRTTGRPTPMFTPDGVKNVMLTTGRIISGEEKEEVAEHGGGGPARTPWQKAWRKGVSEGTEQRVKIISGPSMYVGKTGVLGTPSAHHAKPGFVLVNLDHAAGSVLLPKEAVKLQGVAEESENLTFQQQRGKWYCFVKTLHASPIGVGNTREEAEDNYRRKTDPDYGGTEERARILNVLRNADNQDMEEGYIDDSKEREENLRYSRSRNPVADAIRKKLNPNQKEQGVAEGEYDPSYDPDYRPYQKPERNPDWDREEELGKPKEKADPKTVTISDEDGNVVLTFPSTGGFYGDLRYATSKGFDMDSGEYQINWQRDSVTESVSPDYEKER